MQLFALRSRSPISFEFQLIAAIRYKSRSEYLLETRRSISRLDLFFRHNFFIVLRLRFGEKKKIVKGLLSELEESYEIASRGRVARHL